MKMTRYLFLIIVLPFLGHAQDSLLTLERLYSSYEFYGERSKSMEWYDGGASFTTLESSTEYPGSMDLVLTKTISGVQSVLIPAQWLIPEGRMKPLSISSYLWSADKKKVLLFTNTKRVWRYHTKGDYYVLDLETKKLQKMGGPNATESELMFAKFSPKGDRVAYVLHHNIYVQSLIDLSIVALTSDGSDKIINGTFDWAYEEELDCRDGFKWSPDGKSIAYWQIDASAIRDFLMINNTDSVYSRIIPVQYPKAGEKPSSARVGIASADGETTKWMNLPGPSDNQYIPRMIWSPDNQSVLVQHLNRAQNHNKVVKCDVKNGETKIIYEDKETAWLEVVDDFQFLKNGKSFTWVSEKSGWKACYIVQDGVERIITPADADMISIECIDEAGGWLYYMASPDNATQRYLYRIKLDGKGKAQRISPMNMPGTHGYDISPDGKYARHSYSKSGVPPVVSIISLPDHKLIKILVTNDKLKHTFNSIDNNLKEFIEIQLDDGVSLDAFMIKPINFDPNKKYPVLFHVYGEPWSQTVLDKWDGGNDLWHYMLAQQGYLIMSIDNRGTPGPKGRAWRKSVYGQIGVLSSADQANGVKKLLAKYDFIDADRVGIWGWSGGGSMTLNALFRYPEIYRMGISIAPVGNQLLYDNIYQERYSGVPQDMPESYEKGSPVNFAKNLQGDLLIIHGTGDDNVHYQSTEVIINELILHNKMFSMMAYPNRSHGIYEGKNTSRHLRETMTNYLKNNLPNGGR